jgi:hypothetical protein
VRGWFEDRETADRAAERLGDDLGIDLSMITIEPTTRKNSSELFSSGQATEGAIGHSLGWWLVRIGPTGTDPSAIRRHLWAMGAREVIVTIDD